jgi:hypothetical protein
MWHAWDRGEVNTWLSFEILKGIARPRHRWEDKIKTDITETEWEGVNWIPESQDTEGAGCCELGNGLLGSTEHRIS